MKLGDIYTQGAHEVGEYSPQHNPLVESSANGWLNCAQKSMTGKNLPCRSRISGTLLPSRSQQQHVADRRVAYDHVGWHVNASCELSSNEEIGSLELVK